MHDVMLSLLAYFLVPVSTGVALLLLLPLGRWSHRVLTSMLMQFTYSKEVMYISFALFAFYAYSVYCGVETEALPDWMHGPANNTIRRWKLERNYYLSLFLAMNLLVINRTLFYRGRLLEARAR